MRFLLFCFIAAVAFPSCHKDTPSLVSTAEFTMNKNVVYMHEALEITAVDTTGKSSYYYDFGDGNTAVASHKITHRYNKGGNFVVKMTIDGKTFSRNIKVHPGVLSYQVKNSAKRFYLNILSYINNYQTGATYRDDYYPGAISDTIFADTKFYGASEPLNHIFSASVFTQTNVEYILYTPNFFWMKEWQHHVFEITDSTLVRSRVWVGVGTQPLIMIKDLP